MANQFLALSLFLMLLSFFIVLNSVSSFEVSKSQPIMNSLSLAFGSKTVLKPVAPAMEPAEDPFVSGKKEGDTLQELEGLFNASISGFQARRNRFGTIMHVRLPIGRFENALDFSSYENLNVQLGRQGAFLPTLITLLRAQERGQSYRLDMVLNSSSDPAVEDHAQNEDFMGALTRITALAQKLEQQGLPTKMMSAGLKQGEGEMLDLYFYRYVPFVLPVEKGSADE